MIINTANIKHIYVSSKYTDMRKQIDGLAMIVTSNFNMNVMDHSLFIFTNRSKTQIKMLYYDYNGFWLFSRKLQKGHFQIFEHNDEDVVEISDYQLSRLVEGMIYESEMVPNYNENNSLTSPILI